MTTSVPTTGKSVTPARPALLMARRRPALFVLIVLDVVAGCFATTVQTRIEAVLVVAALAARVAYIVRSQGRTR